MGHVVSSGINLTTFFLDIGIALDDASSPSVLVLCGGIMPSCPASLSSGLNRTLKYYELWIYLVNMEKSYLLTIVSASSEFSLHCLLRHFLGMIPWRQPENKTLRATAVVARGDHWDLHFKSLLYTHWVLEQSAFYRMLR